MADRLLATDAGAGVGRGLGCKRRAMCGRPSRAPGSRVGFCSRSDRSHSPRHGADGAARTAARGGPHGLSRRAACTRPPGPSRVEPVTAIS